MEKLIEKINNSQYIELETTEKNLFVTSALYTYILTLHKKVSFVMDTKEIERKYTFLPWIEKIKTSHSKSADVVLNIDIEITECIKYFYEQKLKINQKMATALYGGLVEYTNGFQNAKTNGMVFAYAKILLEANADNHIVNNFILREKSLGYMRFHGYMLENMLLCNDATQAHFTITQDILKQYGVVMENVYEIMQEAFRLPYIKESILLDRENKILKLYKRKNS